MNETIDWNRKDYWNEYYKFNDSFMSFHYDHCGMIQEKLDELIDKYTLSRYTIKEDSYESIVLNNKNYSIVISMSCGYVMLTFSKNISMSDCIKFFLEWKECLDGQYDDESVSVGIEGEYTSHPKEIVMMMINNLQND